MRKVIAFCVCFCLGQVLGGMNSNARTISFEPAKLEVQYRFENNVISLGEPVLLLFTVHNGLSNPVSVTLGVENREFFNFSLTTPDGQIIQSKPVTPEGFHVGTGKVVVAAGSVFDHTLLLNQWFEFRSPGTYVVTATLNTDIEVANSGKIQTQGGTLRLVVGPRDSSRLEAVCKDFAKQMAAWPTLADLETLEPSPALRLRYVEDPVAIPYLKQALYAHKQLERDAIAGLESIGNRESIQVLSLALDEKYGQIAMYARFALTRLEGRVTDPRLKEEIHNALAQQARR